MAPLPVKNGAPQEFRPNWAEIREAELGYCVNCRRWLPIAVLNTHIIREPKAPGKKQAKLKKKQLQTTETAWGIEPPEPEEEPKPKEGEIVQPGDQRFWNRWYTCRGDCSTPGSRLNIPDRRR